MRKRDERFANQTRYQEGPDPLADKTIKLFAPKDFRVDTITNSCICPAGKHLYSNGSHCITHGRVSHKFTGTKAACGPCQLRSQCLRYPERTPVRQVSFFARNQASPHQFRLARLTHAMHGKDVLCQIDPNGYDGHDFPSQVS